MTKPIINFKSLAWLASSVLLSFPILQNQAIAANFISAATYAGTMNLDELNGKITFCGTVFNTGTLLMEGACSQIGTISTTSLSGNAQINVETSNFCVNGYCGQNVSIVNTSTGVILLCPAIRDPNGNPVGACLAQKQLP